MVISTENKEAAMTPKSKKAGHHVRLKCYEIWCGYGNKQISLGMNCLGWQKAIVFCSNPEALARGLEYFF